MTRDTLWIERLRARLNWRWWLAVHALLLVIQWASVRAAPIVMQKSNAQGWWALCVTAKGP